MLVNEAEFFRKSVINICGSLDLARSMTDFLGFLRDYIPVAELGLCRFEADQTVVGNLITIAADGRCRDVPTFSIPKGVQPQLEQHLREWQTVKIVNDPGADPLVKMLIPYYFAVADPSVMGMVLVVDGVILGAIALTASGKGAFTPEHARLLGLLREPIGIAMSNALRYEEVLRLKDMLKAENRELSRELLHASGADIVGSDFGLAEVMSMARQVAPLSSPVMLLGETGVGKEVIANALHRLSPRCDAPFVKVNCGAIPESLLDSELFGHEKGAFTGALTQKRGRFERADKGTIFLDEVGELSLNAQVRLLRVLQHHEIERVGGFQTIAVDVRIISATNRNLEQMVRNGTFREDLWYRLNLFPITIPPLRQRVNDIPALVHHFVELKCRELKIHPAPAISSRGLEQLMAYGWPGNVRELGNLIERELILNQGRPGSRALLDEVKLRNAELDNAVRIGSSAGGVQSFEDGARELIRRALRQSNGRIYGPEGAAAALGVNPNTLRSRMRKLGLKKNDG